MTIFEVLFAPLGKSVKVEAGTSLLDAAGKAGIALNNICGGDGICGRCKMIVKDGKVRGDVTTLLTRQEIQEGYVLACQSYVEGDLTVEIPEETRAREKAVIDREAERFRAVTSTLNQKAFAPAPLVTKVCLDLEPPTLDDNLADCQRIQRGIEKATGIHAIQTGLKVIKRFPAILRDNDFKVTVTIGRRRDVAEVMEIEGGDTSGHNYLAVVDMGTSTVVAHMVNVITLETVDAQACFNSQAIAGREVTARIIAAEKKGAEELQKLLVSDINRLISVIAEKNGINLRDINAVVCSGNTIITHFLLGLETRNIRRRPFTAVSVETAPFRAVEVGLKINPRGLLYCVPGISSWVGGDLTAGILATGLYEQEGVGMLVDIGTNGEIILGNREWLIACSASAGPALEGASVECGMVAEKGAIERVEVRDGEIACEVIGNVPAEGICGSGIVDLVAVLLDVGIVDRAGKLQEGSHPGVALDEEGGRFTLVPAAESRNGNEIFITQADVDNIVTAKAAIFAATKIILDRLSMKHDDITDLYLAGGFGNYLNIENAIKIGLLPNLPLSRIHYAGNTSIWGAKIAALSQEAFDTLRKIRKQTTYYDLLGSSDYVEQFRQAMFLPHTDIELFASRPEKSTADR